MKSFLLKIRTRILREAFFGKRGFMTSRKFHITAKIGEVKDT